MKAETELWLRFVVSLAAYALLFLMPQQLPRDAWQDLIGGSLAVVAFVFLVPVVRRNPGRGVRMAALIVMLPALVLFLAFLYTLIWDLLHGGRFYADR